MAALRLTPLGAVFVYRECPLCGSGQIDRMSTRAGVLDIEGQALWEFVQRCKMCSWSTTSPHVKIGV